MNLRLVRSAALALCALFLLSGCPRNPATGERQLILVSEEQEIRMGRQGAAQVNQTMGLYGEGTVGGYLSGIALEMAGDTERPDLPWTFGVADISGVNAFALPGGFIYVTRDILAHFDSEAELAAVIGHEIGHVTARHSVEQMSRQQLVQFGIGLGSVLSEDVAQFSDILGLGMGVLFLKYSRDDERQADRLGLRYMLQQRYDPEEAVDVFRMLQRHTEGSDGGVPTWLSTHPSPANRIEEMRARIDTLSSERLEGTRVGRARFLRRIEGLPFGRDPRDGFFRNDVLIHPEREIRLSFPAGWDRERLPLAANAASPDRDAAVRVFLGDTASMQDAADRFFAAQGVERIEARETTLDGFPAVVGEFRARTGAGEIVRGRIAFVDGGERTFRLLGFAPAGAFTRHEATFRRFISSLERLTDREDLAVEPLRLQLVTVDRRTTIDDLLARRGSPLSAEDLALLNAVEANEPIAAGRTIKWVVGELPPAMR